MAKTIKERLETREPIYHYSTLDIPYQAFIGPVASRFFRELRDKKKILGIKCPKCETVYMPPKSTCIKCFGKPNEWVELSGKGSLTTYTLVNYFHPEIHPVSAPFILGVIQLDGADTGLTHLLGEVEPEEVNIGMRVEAVFKSERGGNILDIRYFRPIKS